jgi:hypothetical protein
VPARASSTSASVPLDPWPAFASYVERVRARPSIRKALEIEMPMYTAEAAAMGRPAVLAVQPSPSL